MEPYETWLQMPNTAVANIKDYSKGWKISRVIVALVTMLILAMAWEAYPRAASRVVPGFFR